MSTERPENAARRTDTATPFATLAPKEGRKQTGPRVKIEEAPVSTDAPPFSTTTTLESTVSLEALRRPFASLAPKAVSPSPETASTGAPPPPSQLFSDSSSPPGSGRSQTSPRVERATTSRRPESTQAGKYGSCKSHGTALTREGACVLCVREEVKKKSERGWRILVILAVVALLAGVAAAMVVRPF